ncbi:lytic transglycosylase domain-containing protein [Caulobacter vibrioides]|nr:MULTISPECIES: transglycosylase SLT domain-containing protein [Caulobacter]YP_002517784.1 soluble lytic transglycosylase PleA [Caulobacter vibrioides NA1000]ACL95876.1 soluble lytic transglycosylase PleA [Caulobacter vibrioides NA1000]ATC25331.1 lytic transglycosylase [Caulobacter vibrioides]ATC29189.1 lytic transglycosylase [Caulobacter vibrioides]AZH13420.1 lytic transglycosylase domain-containing protein [Caulobacter vibrioides]MCY1648359.1 transglycosylase SLT domain-containing protein 
MPAVNSLRNVVESAIQRASNATGVDFTFLMGTAKRESGFNPGAKARTSSASGLFQFVDQTWLATLKKHGSKYGYARYADLISQGADGRYRVEGDEARKAVLGLKMDPHAASLMAGELASDHASYLRGRVGRTPTAGELYAAHFLGPQGSARLIQAVSVSPGANAAAMFPEAAQANRSIFYRDGRPTTVGELYANLTKTGGASRVADPAPGRGASDDQGFIQYATGRRLERIRQQEAVVDLILRGSQDVNSPFGDSGGGMGAGQRIASSMFSAEMLRVLAEANDKVKQR